MVCHLLHVYAGNLENKINSSYPHLVRVSMIKTLGSHQTPVTIDIQASIGYKTIGFYVKYSPCKILDTAYGPEFSALSVGLVLF